MSDSPAVAPARVPPPGIVGLDPSWSHLVTCQDHRGDDRTWHLLDTHASVAEASKVRLTLLCVHGNPSWSFLWRQLLQQAPADVRVVAVDQLDMGFSERSGVTRRLADRVVDLVALTDELEIDGPVVTVAHDWGGPISLGWAQHHHRSGGSLAGLVLTNTAVHQPAGSPAPTVIRATRTGAVLRQATVNSSAFIHAAFEMSRPRLDADVRDGFLAPYRSSDRREAIADFVEDIPLEPGHPSAEALDGIADGLREFADIPSLLLWGPSDLVFGDLYLHDLEARLPHADVHRFVGASHFVQEQADVAGAIFAWLGHPEPAVRTSRPDRSPLWAEIEGRATSEQVAVAELDGDTTHTISYAELHGRVQALAAGLADHGVHAGDRVALLIPPGIDLTVALYACWRMGAVMVLVDSGLGPRNMSRALASANPAHVIGVPRAMVAARAMRWPGARISVDELKTIERRASHLSVPPPPGSDDVAAIVFTSGSTGPSKGVVYTHGEIQAQRDMLAALYEITPDDRLVAAFAPFALLGPALGITSAVPDMDVSRPGTLTAAALGAAAVAVDASLVFASPAALVNVLADEDTSGLSADHRKALHRVRLLLSAGAPVREGLLEDSLRLMPNAEAHTPYGMTEVLPVADISLDELRSRPAGEGVCVGKSRTGVEVMIDLVSSEVIVRADHVMAGYDRLWYTGHRASSDPAGWHRTGDVGHIDVDGYLWIEGRLEHVIHTAAGSLTPVTLEHAAETLPAVRRAAAVGIGPAGTQTVALVLELEDGPRFRGHLADIELLDEVRGAVAERSEADVAAVIVAVRLPVDRRHNSKIDRTTVAAWASKILAGGRIRRL